MARKKKTTKKITERLASVQASSQQIEYQGRVKLQVLHGNKIISTKAFKNRGLPNLFKYISYALAGQNYSDLRPCKICIFKSSTTGDLSNPVNFNWDDAYNNKKMSIASPYIAYDATPVVRQESNGSYSTTFRFKVPFNWLYLKEFNVIGLFTEDDDPCAYYLFTETSTIQDESGQNNEISSWDNQKLDDITGNFSLIVEWTMEVSNK